MKQPSTQPFLAMLTTLIMCMGCPPSGQPAPIKMEKLQPDTAATTMQYPSTMPARDPNQPLTTEELYTAYCGACHSLQLVESQRLDRSNWEWVMSDMIDEYGGSWITEEEERVLVDYLVEHFGPA